MRTIIVGLLLLVILFVGHSLYSRAQIERLLDKALMELPNYPAQSYDTIKPILEFNNLISLGRLEQAEHNYLRHLENNATLEMAYSTPGPDQYSQALQTLDILQKIERQMSIDTRPARVDIIREAKESRSRLQAQGTLSQWESMVNFFKMMANKDLMPSGLFSDFNGWMAETEAVPLRPFGLHDAIRESSNDSRNALQQLGLQILPQTCVMPAPGGLSDQQLIAADRQLRLAESEINNFKSLFKEDRLPAELIGIQGKIIYNRAALKLAHMQDRGETLSQSGSGFLFDLTISTEGAEVPTVGQMIGSYIQATHNEFIQAQQIFSQASNQFEPLREAYGALAAWSEALLAAQGGGGHAEALRDQAAQWAVHAKSAPAVAIVQAMQTNSRVMLIVQMP